MRMRSSALKSFGGRTRMNTSRSGTLRQRATKVAGSRPPASQPGLERREHPGPTRAASRLPHVRSPLQMRAATHLPGAAREPLQCALAACGQGLLVLFEASDHAAAAGPRAAAVSAEV